MSRLSALDAGLAEFSRESFAEEAHEAEEQRQRIIEHFPRGGWEDLALDRYALGGDDRRTETFCYLMEFATRDLGSIGGGSALKHIIYRASAGGWKYDAARYPSVEVAWEHVRGAFVSALELARTGRWAEAGVLSDLQPGQSLFLKFLHVYYKSEILPVYSGTHLEQFWELLGDGLAAFDSRLELNRALLARLREDDRLQDWTGPELMRLLYAAVDPRLDKRVWRIEPGENASEWADCLAGGYICVGWDHLGDLTAYESVEDVRNALTASEGETTPVTTRAARALWALRELEAGDLVVANRGQSHVLAVGTVKPNGYSFRGDRESYRHCVAVDWDTSVEQDVPRQRWGFAASDLKNEAALVYRILGQKTPAPPIIEPVLGRLEKALARRDQAILFGPPGTGKTYWARRFAVWWLLSRSELGAAEDALRDPALLARAEDRLKAAVASRRVWWVVANRTKWSWKTLFVDGSVDYQLGRLARNFPLVEPGDLVIGYQATPDKRIMALARVTEGLHASPTEGQVITLSPIVEITDGPTWEEIKNDPILAASEPVRSRSQGTLFRLTEHEGEHLLALLSERDTQIDSAAVTSDDDVGQLTWLTFHPSFSYEDFVEGFRPIEGGEGGLGLGMVDGVFKRVCRAAEQHPDRRYLVVIDEINRGHVARIFGELITLLETDKRGMSIRLPQSRERFSIPPNVNVLGTMNTADRSIKLLDAALRRRFAFVELMPDVSLLDDAVVSGLPLAEFLAGLNARIASNDTRERTIGHSFFLEAGSAVTDPDRVADIVREEILPLLVEYSYDDYDQLATYLGKGLVDAKSGRIHDEVFADTDGLIAALTQEFTSAPGADTEV